MFTDIRFAFRSLLTTPSFTALVVVVLGLGIGANTAIFSVVHAVLLEPLPFADASRLVSIETFGRGLDDERGADSVAYPDFDDWRAQSTTIQGMSGYAVGGATLTGRGDALALRASFVTPGFFPLLGVEPVHGRLFTSEDDVKGAAGVALISEPVWRQHFSVDPSIVGQAISLDGRAFTIVGVLPEAFQFPVQPEPVQLWVPMGSLPFTGDFKERRGASFMNAIGRLGPGVRIEQAQAEMSAIAARLATDHPRTNARREVRIAPLKDRLVQEYRLGLVVLLAAVAAVLLIGCANVANLLLARGAARRKEIAIRAALGAGRARIVRQLLIESVVLALVAGAVGLLVALWGVAGLVAASPVEIPRLGEVGVDGRVLGFTTLVSMATGLLFGLAPALHLSRAGSDESLKDAGRGSSAGAATRTRQVLVVAEVALSLALLASAGLLVRSFLQLRQVDPGFVPQQALTMNLLLPDAKYPDNAARVAFYRRLLDATAALPGALSRGISTTVPLSGNSLGMGFRIDGRPDEPGNRPVATAYAVSPDYFVSMGIPLRAGRAFTERDDERAPAVVVVSESLAQRYWPGEDAIGKRVTIGFNDLGSAEVVGIAGDVKQTGLAEAPRPQLYTAFPQAPWPFLAIVVRTAAADPVALGPELRAAIALIDPDQPPGEIQTVEQFVAQSMAASRFQALLVASFAGLALLLAGSGLYGVLAYGVAQRRREIGIRMALGAQASDLRTMVVSQAIGMGALGLVVGTLAALVSARVIASLLYGVGPADPATFAAVGTLLLGVVAIAAYLPARRATRVDPIVALRSE